MQHIKKYHIGDACFCWQLADVIDPAVSARVMAIYHFLKNSNLPEILDVVPSYNALAVHLDPDTRDLNVLEVELDEMINEVLSGDNAVPPCAGRTVKIPVRYGGEDLSRVAELNGLAVRQVIELHAAGEYTVAMIGFVPHFPYLMGLDARLATPRLESPRTRVPAGSVAIGGEQTGIYPLEVPGGWNLIGTCDPRLLTDLLPGDGVTFTQVS